MFVYLIFVALGIFFLVLSRKRKKEYRSYGTYLTIGIFLLLLPVLVFAMMFFAIVSGGAIPA